MKLFEILVIEGQLKGQAQATRTDLRATFEKKRHLFEEKRTTFVAVEGSSVVERQDQAQGRRARSIEKIATIRAGVAERVIGTLLFCAPVRLSLGGRA